MKRCIRRVIPKYIVCLRCFLDYGSLVELEAFKLYGDTCLHSTVSTLANTYGFNFHRVSEGHRHRGGGVTSFTRYTLDVKDQERAELMVKPWYCAANDKE